MCGRVVIARCSRDLVRIAKLKSNNMKNGINYHESYNCSPGQYVPGMYYCKGEVILEAMKWGVTVNNLSNIVFNSRSDSINKYSFYKQFSRCVVIIDGYFEWKEKQPYYISIDSEESDKVCFLAGIYISQIDNDGFEYKEVSVITKDAMKDIAFIHHRMPVILSSLDEANKYLDGGISVDDILKDYDKKIKLKFYEVGDLVNKLSNVGKDNIIPKKEIGYNKNKNLFIDSFFSGGTIEKKKEIVPKVNLKKINQFNLVSQKKDTDDKTEISESASTAIGTIPDLFHNRIKTHFVIGKKKDTINCNTSKSSKKKKKKENTLLDFIIIKENKSNHKLSSKKSNNKDKDNI